MKLTTLLPLFTLASSAFAFPHYLAPRDGGDLANLEKTFNDIVSRVDIKKLHAEAHERQRRGKRASTWSPSQLVDVTGEHRFIARTSFCPLFSVWCTVPGRSFPSNS